MYVHTQTNAHPHNTHVHAHAYTLIVTHLGPAALHIL